MEASKCGSNMGHLSIPSQSVSPSQLAHPSQKENDSNFCHLKKTKTKTKTFLPSQKHKLLVPPQDKKKKKKKKKKKLLNPLTKIPPQT